MKTYIISVVIFYDCSNFNRKDGRTCPYNTPKVFYSSHHVHSLFLCICTLLSRGRVKSNCQYPLRNRLLYPCKTLHDIFVYCRIYCMIGVPHKFDVHQGQHFCLFDSVLQEIQGKNFVCITRIYSNKNLSIKNYVFAC